MNRKEIEQRKYNRWEMATGRREIASTIRELSPDCKGVEIQVKLSFISGVGKSEKGISRTLGKDDKAFLYHDCLNPDCTGFGFSLVDEIYSAIMSRQIIEGIKRCEGKEDWKYVDHAGCSCQSECMYRIIPIF